MDLLPNFVTSSPAVALEARALADPARVAMIDAASGVSWSVSRLHQESGRLARRMAEAGMVRGDVVAIHLSNRFEFVVAVLAGARLGMIVAPLGTRFEKRELETLFGRIRPAFYVAEADLFALCADLDTMPDPTCRWILPDAGDAAVHEHDRDEVSRDMGIPQRLDEPAALIATSGTTGDTKLTVWNLRTLSALAIVATDRGWGPDDVFPMNFPMAHASGLSAIYSFLLTGAVPVLVRPGAADALLDVAAAYRCTSITSFPRMFSELADGQLARPRDLGSLRRCICGGDVCPPRIEARFREAFGIPLWSVWGATEDLTVAFACEAVDARFRIAPVGAVRLLDPRTGAAAQGQFGEMATSSAGTAAGYWAGPGDVRPLPDGWFRTGDLVRHEGGGVLRFMGRCRDLVATRGGDVSPVEIERHLLRHPLVQDAVVVGVTDHGALQRLGALVVLDDEADPSSLELIRERLRMELAEHEVPTLLRAVDRIPRTPVTKVDRIRSAALLVEAEAV